MKMELKHDMIDGPHIEVSEAYSGFSIKTDAGTFGICQRDQGLELHLDAGPWFSWQDKRGPVKLGPPTHAPATIESLVYMSSFRCEHGETDACENGEHRGAICNSCWTRSWAQSLLRAAGVDAGTWGQPPPDKKPEPRDPNYGDPDLIPDRLGSLGRSKD